MNQSLSKHIENLKSALLSLPATGELGFEGLIGTTLREISGVPFRLAGSGSQFGVDGKSAYEADAICFEGKRYDSTIPRNEVITKIAELPLRGNETDVWVLGATSQVMSQLAEDARARGRQDGIFVLILDWSKTDLPPFAVALAMGGTRTEEFLKSHISGEDKLKEALAALEAIRETPDFEVIACRIRAECNAPAVGSAIAQKANADWLIDAFSNRRQAKVKLGQPLSPGDADTAKIRQRNTLIDQLHPYLTTVSDETVVCILGGEGCGKSWIVAQSWLTLEHKPLMIFISPDDFAEVAGQNDVDELLTSTVIKQTGDKNTEVTQKRWSRRLAYWRDHPATDSPRLIVVIDGINQRPKTDWARIIEHIEDELFQLGGRLIVTSRTPYFRDRVERRLSVNFGEIPIPEWTKVERNEILVAHGIKPAELHQDVAASLLNPRLLGIALELMDKADITNFEELSVSRLLFEHIRMSERDAPAPQPAYEFIQRLQKDAQEILTRVSSEQQDDLHIFEDDMAAVAHGRFYHSVDGDSTRVSLKEEGLTLALGFAVIDRLRAARRNSRNLDAELDAILEPITALDDTANVIFAALTVSHVDENYQQDIATSLVKGYALLQNPDEDKFPAFASLAKRCPQGFMDAARALCLAGSHQPNFDWIQGALIIAGKDANAWPNMADEVCSWLSFYSLSPERGSFSHPRHDPLEKVQTEREKNRQKIAEKLEALSDFERSILEGLQEEEGSLSNLARLALLLLAGKNLAPFAKSLLNWSFADTLNPDHAAPYKDFQHLVQFNRVDWSHTRAALLEVCKGLSDANVSNTGKWALVYILRATGDSDDEKQARLLIQQGLSQNRSHPVPFRLVERYCTTDPCDPASEKPENVTQTAELYAEIDASQLRQGINLTVEEDFLFKARPAMARFLPEAAIAKHREFAAHVLSRSGFALRQGLFELHKHNSLLTIDDAHKLVKNYAGMKTSGTSEGLSERDILIVSLYHLLLAFPFYSAREQVEILLSNDETEHFLPNLIGLMKPLDMVEFEDLLEKACNEGNERKQYLLLGCLKFPSVDLPQGVCTRIGELFRADSERVRVQVLRIIAQSGDETLLRQIAKSEWNAANAEMTNSYEAGYGSLALLEASSRGLIAHQEALDRISPRLYGWAATVLDEDAVREIARRIDTSISQAADLAHDIVAPDITLKLLPTDPYEPSLYSVSERSSELEDPVEAFRRLSESHDAIEERQRRNYDSFLKFKDNLTKAKATIILDHLSMEEFEAVVRSNEVFANRWYSLFMEIDNKKLPAVHNLVLLLALALGKKDPDRAGELFRRVENSEPLVRFTFHGAGIELDAMASWAGGRHPVLDKLRFSRLDRAKTDHDFSLEVLAALLNDQHELLTVYIKTKLEKEEPVEIARGLMVAGFSDQSEFNDKVILQYEDSAGLIGRAQNAAKYAYERNVWARYWFEQVCQTEENIDFWRYAMLFLKIVDGRFDVWCRSYTRRKAPIELFGPSIKNQPRNRYKRWENHRKKDLFGDKAPAPIFLNSD